MSSYIHITTALLAALWRSEYLPLTHRVDTVAHLSQRQLGMPEIQAGPDGFALDDGRLAVSIQVTPGSEIIDALAGLANVLAVQCDDHVGIPHEDGP